MTLKMSTKQGASSWFTTSKPNESAPLRLFCFPYAGGGARIFRPWFSDLPPTIEVVAALLPGRDNRVREPPMTSINELILALGGALLPQLAKPFAFFGHSMGATLAFELARWLREEHGKQPVRLFVSGRRAPQEPRTEPIIHDLPEEQFKEQLRSLNGTPEEVLSHPELMELMIPLLRADFFMVETYQYIPGLPLDCPINVFGGLHDPHVTRPALQAWQAQTIGKFKLHMMPGDHFFLHSTQRPMLQVIAHELTDEIRHFT